MVFIREIPEAKLTDEVLAQYAGPEYKIVYEESSVVVWGLM